MGKHLDLTVDTDGVAAVTLDVAGRSMNVITPALIAEFDAALKQVRSDTAIKGLLIVSAKASFVPGYDLGELVQAFSREQSAAEFYRTDEVALSKLYRRLETCGKPVAAAINGLALGGGLELALACHYRVLADDPKAIVGLPEVKVGLLPGAGGTQRLPRLIGIEKALPVLLEGVNVHPAEALKLGIVDEVVPVEELVATARRWLLNSPSGVQPWDRKGFQVPGGTNILQPAIANAFTGATALVVKSTQRNYPAPIAILSAVFEGIRVPIDTALQIESKYFSKLATGVVARNLIRTSFIHKGQADKLNRRPAGPSKLTVKKLGVLGAGMMGAGIAHVAAMAGIEVVLLDTTQELADRGKAYSAKLLDKEGQKGRLASVAREAILERIRTTHDYVELAGADLVIEAVFENRAIKADVTKQAEAVIPRTAIFASNTSTLPISGLAEASERPAQFIGLHFFSPVERMALVEVIVGKKTSEATLARALDFVAQLKKTPIVVNDSRGFYTSRVFGTYWSEGQRMLEEGVDPALIENAARAAGFPVGPLAVSDEVSLELLYKVLAQERADLGDQFREPISWGVLRHFVEDLGRLGRKGNGGFYDYPTGARKRLWAKLATEYPRAAIQPSIDEAKTRLLYIQAIEAARSFEEGVVTSPAEADLGSVLGWGFPTWTGGTLSFIDTVGIENFVAGCERLTKQYGARFKPSRELVERARRRESFHKSLQSGV